MPEPGQFDVTKGSVYIFVSNAEVYRCPKDETVSLCSYGANCRTRNRPRVQIKQPANTVLLSEEGSAWPTTNDGYLNVDYNPPDWVVNRHNKGSVYSFCDGHILWQHWDSDTARQHFELE